MADLVTFEKVVADGQGLGYWHDKALFVPGPLVGESAEIVVTNEKTKSAQGIVTNYTVTSEHRGPELESHYQVCSPWQNVAYPAQLEMKRAMLTEAFARPGLELSVTDIVGAPLTTGYRNKLEFSFMMTPEHKLSLAFHERGSMSTYTEASLGCVLGSDRMNDAARKLTVHLDKLDLGSLAESLMIRESQTGEGMIAIIKLKAKTIRNWQQLKLDSLTGVAVLGKGYKGRYETIWSEGSLALGETILGIKQYYPWDSFFQTNVSMFERALERIVTAVPSDARVVDLYGGAGSIGLALAKTSRTVVGVDIVRASVEVARRNGKRNGFTNYRAIITASERIDPAILRGVDVIIVDPPRAGLATKVVDMLLKAAPATIIYLSCNPVTQVRDLLALKTGGYQVGNPTGFDFYPGTLHLESLVILKRPGKRSAK